MTDPAGDAARAAAVILFPDLGPDLPAQVEAALHARNAGQQRPGQYDPLAIAGFATSAVGLIVSIAQLAWSIFSDQRQHTPGPSPNPSNARSASPCATTTSCCRPAPGTSPR